MKTPVYITRTLTAGAYDTIWQYGRYICVQTITGVTSLQIGLDEDPRATIFPRKNIDCGNVPYQCIRLHNPGVVSATITMYVGGVKVEDAGDDASVLAVLTTIASRLAGVATLTQPVIGALPVAPAAGVQILAANASRRRMSIQASLGNVGTVYLGKTAAKCTAADHFAQLAPGQTCPEDYYTGAIFGAGTDAADTVAVYEL